MAANSGPLTAMANALHPGTAKKPKIKTTDIQHHPDGSHTTAHTMDDGSTHPNSGASADLDGLHDKLHENLSGNPLE